MSTPRPVFRREPAAEWKCDWCGTLYTAAEALSLHRPRCANNPDQRYRMLLDEMVRLRDAVLVHTSQLDKWAHEKPSPDELTAAAMHLRRETLRKL